MKAAFVEKPGVITTRDIPVPAVGDGDVLIRVMASGICGTDIHIFHGQYLGTYPIIPGHEFSGVVEKVGSKVTRFKQEDHVAVEPNIACDNCPACLRNHQNFCENWNGIGVTLPGGMAEYVVAPEKAVFGIGDLPFNYGSFVEPLSCVLYGVARTGIRLGDRVLIIGAGPIGILLSKVIQLQGACEITQIDKNAARLELAQKSGPVRIEASLDAIGQDFYDVVVDATGSPAVMGKTPGYARYGGKILLFGVPPNDASLTMPAFPIFRKSLTILSSYTSVRNSIQAVRLLQSGKVEVGSLISHELPLDSLEQGIHLIEEGKEGVRKVLIHPAL